METASILLNGKRIDLTQAQLILQNDLPEWERDIFEFLAEWFSDSTHISVHTSGSTGKPKIISKSKSTLRNSAQMTGEFFQFQRHQTALLCLPAKYIAGKMMLVRAIVWQLDLIYITPQIELKIPETAIYFGAMTPQQVSKNLANLRGISQLIIGGAPISPSLEKEILNIPPTCFATYGMTETVSHIALRKIKTTPTDYQTLPHIRINTDSRNCLVIEAPKLLSEKIVTNDLVTISSPKSFQWVGRIDHVINTGGVKISPEKVESKIAQYITAPFFIGGVDDEKWGQNVVLLLESNPFELSLLKTQLKEVLSKFENPHSIHFIEKFKRTENGKLQRNETLKLLLKK
tara:strand:+ start:105851 stop:106888 length:1038 start_codon:yes stop_codon:yes gene_type:complete